MGISGTILYNLYETEKFEELQSFLDKSQELSTSVYESEDRVETKKEIEKKVDDLQELGAQIILDIQEEVINNIDRKLVENNKEKVKMLK